MREEVLVYSRVECAAAAACARRNAWQARHKGRQAAGKIERERRCCQVREPIPKCKGKAQMQCWVGITNGQNWEERGERNSQKEPIPPSWEERCSQNVCGRMAVQKWGGRQGAGRLEKKQEARCERERRRRR